MSGQFMVGPSYFNQPIQQPFQADLPGCGFRIDSSPPHWSSTHHLHNDPPIATEHQIKSIGTSGNIEIVDRFHTPFLGQATLNGVKW